MAITFTNQATLNYNGGSVLSNVAEGIIEGLLTVNKQAVSKEYCDGETITYIISIINNGTAEVSGLTVTDDLGACTFNANTLRQLTYVEDTLQYYQNGILQTAPAETAADGLVISGITVPANGNVSLVYAAKVNEYAPLATDSTITNTVTVDAVGMNAVSAEATVATEDEADISIIKSISPVPVADNGEITYTFELTNNGNTALTDADNAVISDTFQPILSNISVTLDGTPLALNTGYNYTEGTGVFSTVQGVVTVPAATYKQNETTGVWTTNPGTAVLVVTGTITSA